mmetsp:Transcript_31007/g.78424  ORF Transcript_31007/g.78424 Transcript_31007/m.78424 type:complete len:340 (+) Transcript_31007:4350-5369(+)
MLHGDVHRQTLVGVLCIQAGVSLQHELAEACVALLCGHVQRRAKVLALREEGLAVVLMQQLEELEDGAMTRSSGDMEEGLTLLRLEGLEAILDDVDVAMRPGFGEHLEHLGPPWVCQELLQTRQVLVAAVDHGLGGEEVLEALDEELEAGLAAVLGQPEEHRVPCHHGTVKTGPNLLALLRYHLLGLTGKDLEFPFELHVQTHLLQDVLAALDVLLFVVSLRLLPALHPIEHDVERDAIDRRECGTSVLRGFLLLAALGQALGLLLHHRLQVAQKHAEHHRIAEHVLLGVGHCLVLTLLRGRLALAKPPEEPVETLHPFRPQAPASDRTLMLVGEILEL